MLLAGCADKAAGLDLNNGTGKRGLVDQIVCTRQRREWCLLWLLLLLLLLTHRRRIVDAQEAVVAAGDDRVVCAVVVDAQVDDAQAAHVEQVVVGRGRPELTRFKQRHCLLLSLSLSFFAL